MQEEAETVKVSEPDPAPRVVEDPTADVEDDQAVNFETVAGNLKPPKILAVRSVPNYSFFYC